MVANFHDDLSRGDKGERDLRSFFPGFVKGDGREVDLFLRTELKTDYTDLPNFFFEMYSNLDVLTWGGPWKAHRDGCAFLYYYVRTEMCYLFLNTEKLVARLKQLIDDGQAEWKVVPNEGYNTGGWAVRRDLVKDVCTARFPLRG